MSNRVLVKQATNFRLAFLHAFTIISIIGLLGGMAVPIVGQSQLTSCTIFNKPHSPPRTQVLG